MTDDARTLASTYFRAWKEKDFATLRSVLADDATFRGPLGSADDAETCIQGLKGMGQILTDIVIHHTFVDGPDVLEPHRAWQDHRDPGDLRRPRACCRNPEVTRPRAA